MKKVILVIILILLVSNAYATDTIEEYSTDAFPNGRFIDGVEQNAPEDQSVNFYIMGVIDALYATNAGRMEQIYPNIIRNDVIEAVKLFYKQNPTQKYRRIVDVVLSGCK